MRASSHSSCETTSGRFIVVSISLLSRCSAARALELVGERWSLLIIRNAVFAGMTRFSDFERRLGIAPNILAKRLDGFVSDGLMVRRATTEAASVHECVLTQKGRELGMVVMALTEWGDRWAAPEGPPILFEHKACGGSVHLSSSCDACGQAPAAAEILAVPGPGARPDARPHRARKVSSLVSSELTGLVTYDDRLAAAAEAAGSQSSARTTDLCAISSRPGGLAAWRRCLPAQWYDGPGQEVSSPACAGAPWKRLENVSRASVSWPTRRRAGRRVHLGCSGMTSVRRTRPTARSRSARSPGGRRRRWRANR